MGDGHCGHGYVDGAGCRECWHERHQAQERAQVLRKARELLPYAIALVDALGGPTTLAGDHDPVALALAYANRRWLRATWCPGHGQEHLAYWLDLAKGAHGWMCTRPDCLGLVQLG